MNECAAPSALAAALGLARPAFAWMDNAAHGVLLSRKLLTVARRIFQRCLVLFLLLCGPYAALAVSLCPHLSCVGERAREERHFGHPQRARETNSHEASKSDATGADSSGHCSGDHGSVDETLDRSESRSRTVSRVGLSREALRGHAPSCAHCVSRPEPTRSRIVKGDAVQVGRETNVEAPQSAGAILRPAPVVISTPIGPRQHAPPRGARVHVLNSTFLI